MMIEFLPDFECATILWN